VPEAANSTPTGTAHREAGDEEAEEEFEEECEEEEEEADEWESASSSDDDKAAGAKKKKTSKSTASEETQPAIPTRPKKRDYKMVLVLRRDLKPTGAASATWGSSAAIAAVQRVRHAYRATGWDTAAGATTSAAAAGGQLPRGAEWAEWLEGWDRYGCAKISVRCDSTAEIVDVWDAALKASLPCVALVRRPRPAPAPSAAAASSGSADGSDAAAGKTAKRRAAQGPQYGGDHLVAMDVATAADLAEAVCLAVGPAPRHSLASVTDHLKLF
jgi:peptidyl-tRNA hydrolase